jgi:1-acyl-sn-glycerol-3-phosphate acyltransferase
MFMLKHMLIRLPVFGSFLIVCIAYFVVPSWRRNALDILQRLRIVTAIFRSARAPVVGDRPIESEP